jgi:glycosyltransferase involved in cell wall biosynthesis
LAASIVAFRTAACGETEVDQVEALATREGAAVPPRRDDELVARLELELPRRVAVGRGSAVFVYGSCFHRRRRVTGLRILADGRSIEPMAHGMPRLDLYRRDPAAYRSAFWGIVPLASEPSRRAVVLGVAATLDDGREVVADVGTVELDPGAAEGDAAGSEDGRPAGEEVAICMATYNPPRELLRRQVESIRAQTHPEWVCVISDDHSDPDRFAEIESLVGEDPRFRVSRAPGRLGFYRNFERALTMAPSGAAFVALADQDDCWHPDKLETLVRALGDAQLAYSDARVVDADGIPLSDTYWSRRRTNHSNLASLLIANSIVGAASLFRRSLLDRVLPFPPQLGTQWHDHWIALVAVAGGRVSYVDRALYDYVQHGEAVLGHAAANPLRGRRRTAERARMLRDDWRGAFAGWCWKYFYGVCRVLLLAQVLELRCGDGLRGRKRRALRRFEAIDRSPLGFTWLWLRRLRRLAGLNETGGEERLFLHGLAWRRMITLLTWRRRRPPAKLHKDASLPREWPHSR